MEPQMEIDSSDALAAKTSSIDAELPPPKPRRIRALDQDVVNKIAAGEIIVAPMHALKELIENSVDAGSTSIEILVKDGGLKLLQITDNGHGIDRDDLPMLCERFTTSKLQSFEDLTSIGTYGFRGEALASISHIAHLTVATKTSGSSCAWKAHYGDGKLTPAKPGQSEEPKATAGRGGTQITVEDLFYNVPTRRRAFRSSSEEYAKILDVVGRYAVHRSGVAFSCKKHGDSGTSISTSSNSTTVDRIRQIHGSSVAGELVDFEVDDETWGFRASGWATNANYHVKKTTILLFINHRSVESSAVRKAVEQTYSTFLPKGGHPFVYIDLEIEPQRVDVNVHPTKREVNFLNEDEIIECICNKIKTILAKVDSSRTFMTQSLLPGTNAPASTSDPSSGRFTAGDGGGTAPKTPATTKRPYENNLVRTDAKLRKITSMLQSTPSQRMEGADNDNLDPETQYETDPDREPVHIRLTSIKNLRAAVRSSMHNTLTESLSSHTYIGLVDPQRRIAAIQSGVKLLLIDYGMISNEYFYQVGLTDFGNFGTIKLDPPPKLTDLLTLAANIEKEEHLARQSQSQSQTDSSTPPKDNDPIDFSLVPPTITNHLISHRQMLNEYFSLEISEEGDLLSIPLLQRGYMPPLAKLPRFLMRLGPYVNWGQEEACFKGVLRELASFYTPEQLPQSPASGKRNEGEGDDEDGDEEGDGSGEDPTIQQRRKHLTYALEHVLFPAFRSRLIATDGLLKGVIEVADLKGLYRVFERC